MIGIVGRAILPAAAFQAALWRQTQIFAHRYRRLKAGGGQDWPPHVRNTASVRRPLVLVLAAVALLGCRASRQSAVVVYVSEDQVFSEPILKDFERASGIRVNAVFDTEEAKSTGVMNRLIAKKEIRRRMFTGPMSLYARTCFVNRESRHSSGQPIPPAYRRSSMTRKDTGVAFPLARG
jgi:hypothetical protein